MGLLDFFMSPPDRTKFGAIVIRWLDKTYPGRAFRFDPEQFRVVENPPGSLIYNLDNVYRDYCAAPRSERDKVLERYGQSLLGDEGPPDTFAEARAHILPVIRSRALAEYVRLSSQSDGKPSAMACSPFSEDALVMLAYDTEHSTMSLTEDRLRDWDVSFQTVLDAALDNLRDASAPRFAEYAPGLFIGDWNDSYDPSRMLFSDLIHQVPLGGERVAMIPNRNRLLVASSNDSRAQLAMIELAREIIEAEGRSVSSLMYRFDGGRATAWQPSDPQVQTALAQLRMEMLAEDYASQKNLLDKYYETHGIDVFVATYQLIRSDTSGRVFSMAVWTETVDTLLPKTEVVALVANPELPPAERTTPRLVDWDELQRITGAFELVEDCYPPRYRPANMPSAQERLAFSEVSA